MRKKILYACIASVLLILISGAGASTGPEDEVLNTANNALEQYKEMLIGANYQDFGFSSMDEVKKATLGEPFQACTIEPAICSEDKSPSSISDKLTPHSNIGSWCVPVLVNDDPRVLIYVREENGVYDSFGFGSSGIAQRMRTQNLDTMARILGLEGGDVSSMKLVRCYQAKIDFWLLETSEGEYIFPVYPELIGLQENKAYSTADFMPILSSLTEKTALGEIGGGGAVNDMDQHAQKDCTQLLCIGLIAGVLALATAIGYLKFRRR